MFFMSGAVRRSRRWQEGGRIVARSCRQEAREDGTVVSVQQRTGWSVRDGIMQIRVSQAFVDTRPNPIKILQNKFYAPLF